jgi:hypothetical protein
VQSGLENLNDIDLEEALIIMGLALVPLASAWYLD